MSDEREIALLKRFDDSYPLRATAAMRAVESSFCGCSFGASGWCDQAEAEAIAAELGLGPESRVLEIGAGGGWPGLWFAKVSGCEVVLVDIPEAGLAMAREQAAALGLADRVTTIAADAAGLDLPDGSQPVITHSDVLCCLPRKREVLESCRRLIAPVGRMLFTVVHIADGLSPGDRARAAENAPDFTATEAGYPEMLRRTGWHVERSEDLTPGFERALGAYVAALRSGREDLVGLLGQEAWEAQLGRFAGQLDVVREGLLRRALYRVAPAAS